MTKYLGCASWLLVAALTLVPKGGASGQDDAGTGTDAPDGEYDEPLFIPLGSFRGEAGPADPADWYYVRATPGMALHATLLQDPGTDVSLIVVAADFKEKWYDQAPRGAPGDVKKASVWVGASGVLRVGVERYASSSSGGYGLRLEESEGADVSFTVEVSPDPLTPTAERPTCTIRTVTLTFHNAGGPAENNVLYVWAYHDVGQGRPLAHGKLLSFEGRSTRTVSYEWDTTGTVGDARLDIHLRSPADGDESDNRATMRVPVLLPQAAGLSASPLWSACPTSPWGP